MKYISSFFIATGLILFGASPVLGKIYQGDFLCYLLFSAIVYLPYSLVLTAITFIVLAVFKPAIPFDNKLKYSIFLSIWIEKRGVVESYKQYLNQLDYELYEPTYIPDGYKLFESRVDRGNLSFYYAGNEVGQFVISEFKKSQR